MRSSRGQVQLMLASYSGLHRALSGFLTPLMSPTGRRRISEYILEYALKLP